MILGLGSDLVEIGRIARLRRRFGERFEARVFTQGERQLAASRPALADATYAKRFAAKEACLKALGCGLAAGIRWQDIAVTRSDGGRPALLLQGEAARRLAALAPAGRQARAHLSLSDDGGFAFAQVVLEAADA